MRRVRQPLTFVVIAAALMGCSGGETANTHASSTGSGPDAGACGPGDRAVDGMGCVAAGVQDDGCDAGEIAVAGGGCRPAGVPADACGTGFAASDGGCAAILPGSLCPAGTMAIPGETACRSVASCGTTTWGAIPVDATTQYVDASYTGGASDGTALHPWTNVPLAIGAAQNGAIIAIAAGSYATDVLVTGKSVRLWGRCPDMVEIVGTSTNAPAVFIKAGASGTELHDVAVRGAAMGVGVQGSKDVVLDHVWIHDTGERGVAVQDLSAPAAITIADSLIESATTIGVHVVGGTLALDRSVVRSTKPSATDATSLGRGIDVEDDRTTKARGTATITSSVVSNNRDSGILAAGADLTITTSVVSDNASQPIGTVISSGIAVQLDQQSNAKSTLSLTQSIVARNEVAGVAVFASNATLESVTVRDNQPQASNAEFGFGIYLGSQGQATATAAIRSSLLDKNRTEGIVVDGADATIESTLVRGTQPQMSDLARGRGIDVEDLNGPTSATITSSAVVGNREAGIYLAGAQATLTGVAVRDTEPSAIDMAFGYGIGIDTTSDRSQVALVACDVANNHDTGIFIVGSDVTMDATVVENTAPAVNDGSAGQGLQVQTTLDGKQRATLAMRTSRIEANHYVGLANFGADATIDSTLIRNTGVDPSSGDFGDGIAIVSLPEVNRLATATLTRSRIEQSARAGVSSFGGSASLANMTLACNAIQLDGETRLNTAPVFDDLGSNTCECGGQTIACAVRSSGLTAPSPLTTGP